MAHNSPIQRSVLPLTLFWCLWYLFSVQLTKRSSTAAPINCNVPPLEAHPKDCCVLPSLIEESLLQNCKTLHGGEPLQRTLIYERGKCFIECALNATGTMVNGQLHQQRILELIEGGTRDDPGVMQLFQSNALLCLQSANKKRLEQQTRVGCSSQAVDFVGCVNIQNFLNCPVHRWSDTEQCNNLKQFLIQCPQPF